MDKSFKDPISGFTHLFGAVISLFALIAMVIKYASGGYLNNLVLASSIIFGLSLILLYTASSVYHLVITSDGVTKVLRKLDHSMIFILIAGSYTPICLISLQGYWRWGIFIAIWSLAILGVLLKVFWFNSPRILSTSFYIFMGWVLVAALKPLSKVLPIAGFVWLFVGGVFYTIGGVIYAVKVPNISKRFGFHELFHIFVLMGSFSHFLLVYKYIM